MEKLINTGFSSKALTRIALSIGFCFLLFHGQPCFSQPIYKQIFAIKNQIFSINVSQKSDGSLQADVYLGDKQDEKKVNSFNFYSESYEIFKTSLTNAIDALVPKESSKNKFSTDSKDWIDNVTLTLYRELVIFEYKLTEEIPLAGSILLSKNVRVYPAVTEKIPCKKTEMTRFLIKLTDKSIESQEKLKKLLEQIKSLKKSDLSSLDSINLLSIKKYQLKDRLLQTNVKCLENRKILKKLFRENKKELKEKYLKPGSSSEQNDSLELICMLRKLKKMPSKIVCQSDSIPVSETIKKILGSGLSEPTKGKLIKCINNIKSTCNCTPIKLSRRELKRGINDAFADISVTQDQIGICNRWIELLRTKQKINDSLVKIKNQIRSYQKQLETLSNIINLDIIASRTSKQYYISVNPNFKEDLDSLGYFKRKFHELAIDTVTSINTQLDAAIAILQKTDALIIGIINNFNSAKKSISIELSMNDIKNIVLKHKKEKDSISLQKYDSTFERDTIEIKEKLRKKEIILIDSLDKRKQEIIYMDSLKNMTWKIPDSLTQNSTERKTNIADYNSRKQRIRDSLDGMKSGILTSLEKEIQGILDTLEMNREKLNKIVNQNHDDFNQISSRNNELMKYFNEIDSSLQYFRKTVKVEIDNLLSKIDPFSKLKDEYYLTVQYIHDLEKSEKSLLDPKKYEIDLVQIEFNDGVLKNIVVTGNYQCKQTIYTNIAPIQFTGITHLEKINDFDLFDMNRQNTIIRLGDVLTYIPALHVDAEDYCPSDSVYSIEPGPGPVDIKKATKEKLNRILEAKTYTDLVGFGVDQPNGLIQFEISKKIPLFTHRIKYSKNYRSFISFGSYYEPTFTLAKLEQNNKFYYPIQQEDISGKLDISTIDVYKYSSMRMAVLYMNLINWEIAEVKSAVEFNGGFSLLYTPVKDSVSDKNSVSQWGAVSGMPFMEIKFLIKPDTRYGFSLSANLGWLFLWDTRLKMINDPMNPTDSKSYNRKLLSFRFDAFYKPFRHSENAAFFRVTNVHTFPMSLTYLQVQLGFAFNIFGKSSGQK